MAYDRRSKNADWYIRAEDGTFYDKGAHLAVMIDIRDELQALNRVLNCPNFLEIPAVLRAIRRGTAKPRKRRKPATVKGR